MTRRVISMQACCMVTVAITSIEAPCGVNVILVHIIYAIACFMFFRAIYAIMCYFTSACYFVSIHVTHITFYM